LKLFLQCGESEIASAIAVVGKARSDMLTHTLIDYLMGETDGVPKDPNYIYRCVNTVKCTYTTHYNVVETAV
jgi:WD repeat-containing protein 19